MDKMTVLVSGGTDGIGKEIVLKFAQNGWNISTFGRDEKKIEAIKEELKSLSVDYLVESVQAQNKSDLEHFFKKSIEHFGGVDVLVNNVGIFIPGNIQDELNSTFDLMMNVNLTATYLLCKLCIPSLKLSPNPAIFNICSTASITPYINGGTYCISKYAQYGLTKVLREELKKDRIRVTAVLPGATYTNSWEGTDLPESRFIDPKTIAEAIFNTYLMPPQTVVEEILIRPIEGDIE